MLHIVTKIKYLFFPKRIEKKKNFHNFFCIFFAKRKEENFVMWAKIFNLLFEKIHQSFYYQSQILLFFKIQSDFFYAMLFFWYLKVYKEWLEKTKEKHKIFHYLETHQIVNSTLKRKLKLVRKLCINVVSSSHLKFLLIA